MNKATGNRSNTLIRLLLAFALAFSFLPGCSSGQAEQPASSQAESAQEQAQPAASLEAGDEGSSSSAQTHSAPAAVALTLNDVPTYSGSPSVEVLGNTPQFTEQDKARGSFEEYSPLDDLGRCGVAFALVGTETMPTEKRGSIGEVKPSGWHTVRYNGIVDGNYLYNRCHLIGYQLAGENANPKNLITGTRYLNTEGMLPYEDKVAAYVKRTGNHVLYRVTPMFDGSNLVASGVHMEALSVEDNGKGISFNVYCYNVQPQISIDYATGASELQEASTSTNAQASSTASTEQSYVLNTNSKKFHTPGCSAVSRMKEANKKAYTGTRDALFAQGYTPCGICKP